MNRLLTFTWEVTIVAPEDFDRNDPEQLGRARNDAWLQIQGWDAVLTDEQDEPYDRPALLIQARREATEARDADCWGEYSLYPRSQWEHEVGEHDTNLGYWEWVFHQIEAYFDNPQGLDSAEQADQQEQIRKFTSTRMILPTQAPLHVLHAHSKWSVLDGAATVDEYIDYVKEHGLGACGMTEHGLVLGWHELITKCNNAGIKPLAGNEVYLAPRDDYEFKGKPYDYGHLTLWAANEEGFKNLMTLSTRSWAQDRVVKKFGNAKPRVNWDDLALYNKGIICGSGCIEGPIAKPILRGEVNEAIRNAQALRDIFGDRLFMEVMPHAVDRNFAAEVIEVENEQGRKFTFLETDTVDTPEGRMTVAEAMRLGVQEISDPIPQRGGNDLWNNHAQRVVGKIDLSVYGDDSEELLPALGVRRVAAVPGDDENSDYTEAEEKE